MNLDETRRKLRTTEMGLADTKRRLAASEQRCAELTKRNSELEGNAHKAVQLLLPEGTTLSDNWDNYDESGFKA